MRRSARAGARQRGRSSSKRAYLEVHAHVRALAARVRQFEIEGNFQLEKCLQRLGELDVRNSYFVKSYL